MDNSIQIQRQLSIEEQYSRRSVDKKVSQYIRQTYADKILEGIGYVNDYMNKTYYPAKDKRIAQLSLLDVPTLVEDALIGVAYCTQETLFTSVSAQLASRLKFSEKREAIATVAEILAVLCMTDLFDIMKASKGSSLMVFSRMELPKDLLVMIEQSEYLPPMLCVPNALTDNYGGAYLTEKSSLILGAGNHHGGDICLDVLNLMNKIPLKLAKDFICTVEEEPTFELDTPEKILQWDKYKRQSYEFYLMLAQYENEFYVTHKVDKRGRIYSQGYHINPQGTAFKKAVIELAEEEVVTGAP